MPEVQTLLTAAEAYLFCRGVARREAKNFYWAFRVLPRPKSDAMCAVYAFMRRADDISDDELKPVRERRAEMAAWIAAWRRSRQAGDSPASADPVFVALGDAQLRYGIADELLEALVRGTAMDLEPRRVGADGLQTYASFADLYAYCYLVASVVGLVCIRIFGYEDARAEKLAEETGIAFQLTNVLRDVKEDVERGRVYLPLDMMAEFGVTTGRVRELAAGAPMTVADRALLAMLGGRAEAYYRSADQLLPLLHPDSRAAMWVLATIYRRLLGRIRAGGGDVFRTRIRVSAREKLWILSRGAGLALWYRVRS